MDLKHLLTDTYVHMPPANILGDLAEEGAMRRFANLPHCIAEIVAHMNFWQQWFLRRIGGAAAPMAASAAIGWPAAPAGTWATLHAEFLSGLEEAAGFAADPERLEQAIRPEIEFPPLAAYTAGDALVHLAGHNSHHLGQVIILRQLMGSWPPPAGSWTW